MDQTRIQYSRQATYRNTPSRVIGVYSPDKSRVVAGTCLIQHNLCSWWEMAERLDQTTLTTECKQERKKKNVMQKLSGRLASHEQIRWRWKTWFFKKAFKGKLYNSNNLSLIRQTLSRRTRRIRSWPSQKPSIMPHIASITLASPIRKSSGNDLTDTQQLDIE